MWSPTSAASLGQTWTAALSSWRTISAAAEGAALAPSDPLAPPGEQMALAVPLARTERYGIMILVAVVVLLPIIGHSAGFNFNLMAYVMDRPVDYIESAIQWATGVSYD